jgi:Ca-activated chloride channel family protein
LDADTFTAKAQQGEPVPVDDGPWLILLLLPLALMLFRRAPGLLVVLLFLSPPPVEAGWKTWFSNSNQQAWQLFRAQRYQEAAERFEDPLWRAIALYRAGNYRAAAASLSGIDSVLAHYNRGNALVQLGELEAARRAYERALALDPDFSDARYNLKLLDTPAATPLPARSRGKPRGREQPHAGPTRQMQELLAVDRNLQLPEPEETLHKELKSSKGGGMILAPDTTGDKGGVESGQAGQMYREGVEARRREEKLARKGSRENPAAASSRAGTAASQQPPSAGDTVPPDPAGAKGEPPPGQREHGQPGGVPDAGNNRGQPGRSGVTGESPETVSSERQRSLEVWLENIEDNPVELLRAIFQQQLERRQ